MLLELESSGRAARPRFATWDHRGSLHLHRRCRGLLRRAGETTAAIRDWGCRVVAGNCEQELAAAAEDCACGFEEGSECNRLAKGWYPFANARLSVASRAWMAALPKTLTFTLAGLRFCVIHGGVGLVNRFVFASQRGAIAEELEQAQADVVIAGHAGRRSSRR